MKNRDSLVFHKFDIMNAYKNYYLTYCEVIGIVKRYCLGSGCKIDGQRLNNSNFW